MSIVKGASGLLQVQANLITSDQYTFIVWVKPVSGEQGFGTYFNHINAPGASIKLWDPFPDGVRHTVNQSTGLAAATTATAIPSNAWSGIVCPSTGRTPSIAIAAGAVTAPGIYGVFETPSTPTLNLMADSSGVEDMPVGDKIGAVAIYASTLDQADIDHILAGGAFDALPSTTAPVEYWVDSAGVAKDGSNNLTSWTGQVSASVLTPTGTVTVDDSDMVPISTATVTPTTRKSSAFDIETTLGTITTATLNSVNVFDHITAQVGTTVSFAGAATDEITTSGEYALALGDGVGTETITVQVNVYGVAPSNNPLQKDGAALASLTNVEVRVSAGATLAGSQLFYSGTATTDVSGNLGNIDLSSTAAADADPVLLSIRTAAGDSIVATETVGII